MNDQQLDKGNALTSTIRILNGEINEIERGRKTFFKDMGGAHYTMGTSVSFNDFLPSEESVKAHYLKNLKSEVVKLQKQFDSL